MAKNRTESEMERAGFVGNDKPKPEPIPDSEYDKKTGLRKKYLTDDMRKKTMGFKRGYAKYTAEQDAKAKQATLAGNADDFSKKFTDTANNVVKKANQ